MNIFIAFLRLLTKPLIKRVYARYLIFGVIIALIAGQVYLAYSHREIGRSLAAHIKQQQADLALIHTDQALLAAVKAQLADETTRKIDITKSTATLNDIQTLLKQKKYSEAQVQLSTLSATLKTEITDSDVALKKAADEAVAIEKQKGDLKGTITSGVTPLNGATLTLDQSGTVLFTVQTDDKGAYDFHAPAGTYTLTVTANGYITQQGTITISAEQTATNDISMQVVPTPTPTPTPSPSTPKPVSQTPTPPATSSTAHSKYYTTTLQSSQGSFSAEIMQFELGPGKIKVITDTASPTDCANNCPVLSVGSYVQRDGGIAGINGTYFCPVDYSSCSTQVNNFFWKVINSNTGGMINAGDGLGENDPFLTFDSVGNPRIFTAWNDYVNSGYTAYAGINHKPLVVYGGVNSLNPASLDDKQLTAKISRGALAISGNTLYVIHLEAATVPDLAASVAAMGVDYALNIDAGGSSGMYYAGSYRSGPGRGVPNALVFVEQ